MLGQGNLWYLCRVFLDSQVNLIQLDHFSYARWFDGLTISHDKLNSNENNFVSAKLHCEFLIFLMIVQRLMFGKRYSCYIRYLLAKIIFLTILISGFQRLRAQANPWVHLYIPLHINISLLLIFVHQFIFFVVFQILMSLSLVYSLGFKCMSYMS